MAPESRIVELEVRLAFQEKLIAQLDEVVREFAARVETLERELRELRTSVRENAGVTEGAPDEPPPHY